MNRKTLLVGASTVAIGAIALTSAADIIGSSHDFSFFGWSENQICLPCHTPHNAISLQFDDPTVAPLWNHELTTQTFTLYDGQTGLAEDLLDTRSTLCMSCHDGITALDSFGGNTGSQVIGPGGLIGTDLQDDHPIGAAGIYPEGPGVTEFVPPGDWENDIPGMTLQDLDVGGNIERVVSCTSCHEPHKRGGYEHMLWMNNVGSALCLTCHIK